jgi:hypothetical protein
MHTHVIAAFSTIAKSWNQPNFPSLDEWIKKMWYIYMMRYHPVMKKNKIMSFTGKQKRK